MNLKWVCMFQKSYHRQAAQNIHVAIKEFKGDPRKEEIEFW